ncbi:unnamed protein product [Ilex paraguariensis]|uniref:RNase H type-1 domain-containing protein n=1 Tax=Ilex paraguariensis TaxID=185542 RepID=A0ABC8RFW7_9AQUA
MGLQNIGKDREKVWAQVVWTPPKNGWVKLNTNDSFWKHTGHAGAGGLIKDVTDGLGVEFKHIELEVDSKTIQHVYQEANACADWLANLAHQLALGNTVF